MFFVIELTILQTRRWNSPKRNRNQDRYQRPLSKWFDDFKDIISKDSYKFPSCIFFFGSEKFGMKYFTHNSNYDS